MYQFTFTEQEVRDNRVSKATLGLWVHSIKLALCHHPGASNLKVASRFFGKFVDVLVCV
jgi:hypothetical protein